MKINKYFIQETLENMLGQLGYYYQPTKANKKRVCDFFESLPFFFFEINFQNRLYETIKTYPIKSYIDSNENMRDFCYFIYKDFSRKYQLNYKEKELFYKIINYQLHNETKKFKKWKQNNIHTYVFILILCIFLIFYIWFDNKVDL